MQNQVIGNVTADEPSPQYQRFQKIMAQRNRESGSVVRLSADLFPPDHEFNDFDHQGIQWRSSFRHTNREIHRNHRMQNFTPHRSNYETPVKKYPRLPTTEIPMYNFHSFYANLEPHSGHFQLRHCLQAATAHDVLFLTRDKLARLNTPSAKVANHSLPVNFHASCMSGVTKGLFAVGGLSGECLIIDASDEDLRQVDCFRVQEDEQFCNSVCVFTDAYYQDAEYQYCAKPNVKIATASNDAHVKVWDIQRLDAPIMTRVCAAPCNAVKVSPNKKMLALYCDRNEAEIIDYRSLTLVCELRGHQDYGFSIDWHPNSLYVVTGNQDGTVRVWDIRKATQEVKVIQGQVGHTACVQYSASGRYLAFAECIDFVHIVDADKDYSTEQVFDYFGETTGMSFQGGSDDKLFVGARIIDYGGVFELKQRKNALVQSMAEYDL